MAPPRTAEEYEQIGKRFVPEAGSIAATKKSLGGRKPTINLKFNYDPKRYEQTTFIPEQGSIRAKALEEVKSASKFDVEACKAVTRN